ncbi:hypothetical protein P3X46_013649 [Hevea brasiliensis]|uniref:Uncharacterized protein n=1 Tax=Hevea brasiliensis TaxID=3981 RepID=A0ABQ9M6A0_HEVBR|nr:uncharacterized protein LOC110660913 [Hevea brasiliensis]KAJ9175065.1 hypothetical protein P3X46_013649 [Hevea brasiliensis]
MAAPPSKNSSSFFPIPSRPSNPRNSEVDNPIRRSFSGSPFTKPSIITSQRPGFNPNTPANSPLDHPRRSSIGRENIVVSLHDSEDKENSKDQNLKQARVRSPASSKGTKNFMSPTISATSKINASPRKKILTERNEPTCTSVSFSDCKNPVKEDLDLKPEKGLNQKKEVSFDPTITYLEDKDTSKSNEDFDSMVHSSTKDDWELPESITVEKGWRSHFSQKEEVSLDPTITRLEDKDNLTHSEDFDSMVPFSITKDEWDSLSESAAVENDCVNLDPSFKISPRACPLAPLDADPSLPPYDPKTNYLSPRPQFLHYKPNPRIQLYLNKERDGKQLEESSASETSDAEITEEETLSDYSQKESEDASSGDVVNKEEEEEEELLVSGPNPMSVSEEVAEAKRVSKRHFFTKTKFNALLLILAIACLWASVTNSPVMDPSILNNLSFPNPYVPPEISEFIRDNLEGLAQKFRQWIYDSFSYINNLIFSFREWLKPGPLQFANLTTLLEDSLVDNNCLLGDDSPFGAAVKYERNELRLPREGEVNIKSLEEEEVQPIEADENIEELEGDEKETDENVGELEGDEKETDENIEESVEEEKNDQEYEDEVIAAHDNLDVSVDGSVLESEEVNMTLQTEVTKPSNTTTEVTQKSVETSGSIGELQSKRDVVNLPVPISQAAEIQTEDSYSVQPPAENDKSSAETEFSIAGNKPKSLDSYSAMKYPKRSESVDLQLVKGISLLVLGLLAAFAFTHVKNKTSTRPNVAITIDDQAPLTKKLDYSPLSVTAAHTFQERTTEVETVGESCPSEMSSFEYISSYSKEGKKGTREAHSHERKPRKNSKRESLASSDYSTGSLSYGSFTTYEKILSKNGNGEEEFFTPVRRSSRIRTHVTSP